MSNIDLSEDADGAESVDEEQARRDLSLEILDEKKKRLSQELRASHKDGEPLRENDKKLVAGIAAVDKLIQVNQDKADGKRLVRRDRNRNFISSTAVGRAVASAGSPPPARLDFDLESQG